MTDSDLGSFDTRFERLTGHYRDAIIRGDLKPGDRFPSARELGEMHGVGRTTAGRVLGTLMSLGLVELRSGVGTFVLAPPGADASPRPPLETAARNVIRAYDEWKARKPAPLAGAVEELREALASTDETAAEPDRTRIR